MTNPQGNEPASGSRAADLLPEVYAELRRLAQVMTGQLSPGQTLQATALVHEAYLRMVRDPQADWQGRRHFFLTAARAMREILIEQARRKGSYKHGGQSQRVELVEGLAIIEPPADDLLAHRDEVPVAHRQVEQPGQHVFAVEAHDLESTRFHAAKSAG